jgi:hypothetical protein
VVIGTEGSVPRLLLIIYRQHAEDNRRRGREANVHQPRRDGVSNVFEVLCVALDEAAYADDGIDGAGHREESSCEGKLERARDFRLENVRILDFTLRERILDPALQRINDILVPARGDHTDAALLAVELQDSRKDGRNGQDPRPLSVWSGRAPAHGHSTFLFFHVHTAPKVMSISPIFRTAPRACRAEGWWSERIGENAEAPCLLVCERTEAGHNYQKRDEERRGNSRNSP